MFKKALCFVIALGFMALSTGCASGGFKLTRQYARWVNGQNIIIRIVLYILTFPVFIVTLLIDSVVFNTMDFWDGKVSQGTYQFEEEGKKFVVTHEFQGDTKLRKSTIKTAENEIILKETASGEVELYLDGKLRTKAKGISSFAIVTEYDEAGTVKSHMPVNFMRKLLARK